MVEVGDCTFFPRVVPLNVMRCSPKNHAAHSVTVLQIHSLFEVGEHYPGKVCLNPNLCPYEAMPCLFIHWSKLSLIALIKIRSLNVG